MECSLSGSIVAISDFADGWREPHSSLTAPEARAAWLSGERGPPPSAVDRATSSGGPFVYGSYLDRLPSAIVSAGLADSAEVWHHSHQRDGLSYRREANGLVKRAFLSDGAAPYHSNDMIGFIEAFGAPAILCVWGLGVSEAVLEACGSSVIVYNSLDVEPLRVPNHIIRHFDLVLTGADWQSREIEEAYPGLATAILPIGPEFASPETFYPSGGDKPYDVVYVAAAQAYKRHDVLIEALRRSPRRLRALFVIGYGEMGEELRRRAAELDLDIDFVGPPGVPYDEVNRLINLAKIGVVCGVDDGAPAILTEYMLAGLPVVANSKLKCGLQYIEEKTGIVADEARFAEAILGVLDRVDDFSPREIVLDRWIWPRSVEKLSRSLSLAKRAGRRRIGPQHSPSPDQHV